MLTKEQLLERRKGIGASEAKKIISGEWYELWLDKTGRAEPEPILSPWDAAVRHALEPLIMDDYEARNSCKLVWRGDTLVMEGYPFIRCTLDGFDPAVLRGPVDAKALNIWTPDPEQWCIENYTAQMQHQMLVTMSDKSALHVSLGMKRPTSMFFERDEFFLNEYAEKCAQFWHYVETDTAPPGAPKMIDPTPPEKMRVVDMTGSNAWASAAADWLNHSAAAKLFKKAEVDLKAMVEPDVKEASGHNVIIKRAKNGNLSIKETK